MKKTLLLSLATAISAISFAQIETRSNSIDAMPMSSHAPLMSSQMKGTALGDTLFFGTQAQFGAGTNYYYNYGGPADSGFVYGTNAVNWKGFARLYSFSRSTNADTGFNIIGIISKFGGRISTSNTNTMTFSVWPQAMTNKTSIGTKYFVAGMPTGAPLASSATVNAKNVSLTNRTAAYLTTPIVNTKDDLYVGYTLNYTWGSLGNDTFGVQRIADAAQGGTSYYNVDATSKDTLLEPSVIIQESNNTWKAIRWQLGITNAGDPIIYPIIRLNCGNCFPTSIGNITNSGLTLSGLYPIPAVNEANVSFSLKDASDVEIAIMDAAGRTVKTIKETNMAAGTHSIKVPTADLATGNYIMALETSTGGAIAVQFTVSK